MCLTLPGLGWGEAKKWGNSEMKQGWAEGQRYSGHMYLKTKNLFLNFDVVALTV